MQHCMYVGVSAIFSPCKYQELNLDLQAYWLNYLTSPHGWFFLKSCLLILIVRKQPEIACPSTQLVGQDPFSHSLSGAKGQFRQVCIHYSLGLWTWYNLLVSFWVGSVFLKSTKDFCLFVHFCFVLFYLAGGQHSILAHQSFPGNGGMWTCTLVHMGATPDFWHSRKEVG